MPRHSTAGGAGPSQRQLRVAELIRRALSDVFARGDLHDPGLAGASITVGEVRTSPDLRHATVFVLPLGGAGAEALIGTLNRNRGELRRAVTRSVDLKFSPELRFEVDTTFDQMDATRRMLSDPRVTRDLDRDDHGDDEDDDAPDRRDEEE